MDLATIVASIAIPSLAAVVTMVAKAAVRTIEYRGNVRFLMKKMVEANVPPEEMSEVVKCAALKRLTD